MAGHAAKRETTPPPGLIARRPTEDDHPRLARAIDRWWGEQGRGRLPRFWLRNFSGTSWLAETSDGSPAGLLIGFMSPNHPDEAVLQLIATRPGLRRRGIARGNVARFAADARARGARRIRAVIWPGNRVGVAFLREVGFSAVDSVGGAHLYGSPAVVDYDGEEEDRTILTLELEPAGQLDLNSVGAPRSR